MEYNPDNPPPGGQIIGGMALGRKPAPTILDFDIRRAALEWSMKYESCTDVESVVETAGVFEAYLRGETKEEADA